MEKSNVISIPVERFDAIPEDERDQWRELNREEKSRMLNQMVNEMTRELRNADSPLSRRDRKKLLKNFETDAWRQIQAQNLRLPKDGLTPPSIAARIEEGEKSP